MADDHEQRLARLSAEVDRERARAGAPLAKPAEPSQKSVLASGLLSFFFGPLGWLYAGSFREAVPAALAYVLVCAILPKFLLVYILGVSNALTALAGVLYAWSYNRSGKRETLLLRDGQGERRLPPAR